MQRAKKPFVSARTFFCLLLVAVGSGIYSNSLEGPFFYDDIASIVENKALRQLWPPLWLTNIGSPEKGLDGRPVVGFSFAINYAIGGLNVRGYHLVNVAVHILCALALFALVRRTLLSAKLRLRFGAAADGLAFSCALLWIVHPLQSQCVNHIVRRAESLTGLFYLLVIYCIIRTAESHRHRWSVAAVLACGLGMGSKEVMVTAPLMGLLYDRVFLSFSWRQLSTRWGLFAGLAATWLILAALMWTTPHGRSIGFSGGISSWDYALNQCWVMVTYLQHVLWPYNLILDYGVPIVPLPLGEVTAYAGVVVALLLLTAAAWWYQPMFGFLGAWFFVILAPTSSFVPIVNEVGAERRMYLPLAGLVVLSVVVGYLALQWMAKQRRRTQYSMTARIGVVLVVALAIVWSVGTIRRNRDYRSSLAIWQTVVERAPRNPRGYDGVGRALGLEGRTDEAMTYYRRAIEVDPDYADAHYNLAILLQTKGNTDEAIHHYRSALELDPHFVEVHNNLGNALRSKGNIEEATAHYRKALEFDPNYIEAYNNLASALKTQGREDEATEYYRRSIQIDPNFFEAHYNLATLLHTEGKLDEAIANYRGALRLKPDFAKAYNNLGSALGSQGDIQEAIEHYRRAIELEPNFVEARQNLDTVLRLQEQQQQGQE